MGSQSSAEARMAQSPRRSFLRRAGCGVWRLAARGIGFSKPLLRGCTTDTSREGAKTAQPRCGEEWSDSGGDLTRCGLRPGPCNLPSPRPHVASGCSATVAVQMLMHLDRFQVAGGFRFDVCFCSTSHTPYRSLSTNILPQ